MQGHVTVDAVEERCVLVGVITSETTEEVAQEHLDELEFLAETAGAITVEKFFSKITLPESSHLCGYGKARRNQTIHEGARHRAHYF